MNKNTPNERTHLSLSKFMITMSTPRDGLKVMWLALTITLLLSSIPPTISFTFRNTPRHKFTTHPLYSSTITTPSPPSSSTIPSSTLDVVICGAGPGGLLLASELSKKNCRIAIVDPTLADEKWPNNYGVWMDEAEHFGYGDCVDRVWKKAGVVFDEDTEELTLDRPYGRVDGKTMKRKLLDVCRENGATFHVAKATSVEHFPNKASEVKIKSISSNNVDGDDDDDDDDDTDSTTLLRALLVVDATGFARRFTEHSVPFDPGYQVTYGARFRVENLGPYTLDRMILMDYSEKHLHSSPTLTASNYRFPSFVYVMPLGPTEIFMEETILVSRPGGSSTDLRRRLELRMAALGIEGLEVLEDERAAIPMGGMDPVVPQRTLGFGATSSLVHPASGYMVARAMEIAPRVADVVAKELERVRNNGGLLEEGVLEEVSRKGWDAVWPTDERRQRDFMHFGFELLCLLNPQELRDFFTGFFRLPDALWEHFLSWRLSGVGHINMGLRVWAQCIPRRFMPPMLIKSLPFIGNRLVGPLLSRGNYAKIDTESVYADARTGDFTLWEPKRFYDYIETLKKKNYEQQDGEDDTVVTEGSAAESVTKDKLMTAADSENKSIEPEEIFMG